MPVNSGLGSEDRAQDVCAERRHEAGQQGPEYAHSGLLPDCSLTRVQRKRSRKAWHGREASMEPREPSQFLRPQ